MVHSNSYLSVIFKVSWSTDVAQNFQNSLIRSIHILASLIYSPICFYDKYKDSFTHVRVLLYIWYGETVYKRKNVNRGPRSNFLAECVPRPIKFGQPWSKPWTYTRRIENRLEQNSTRVFGPVDGIICNLINIRQCDYRMNRSLQRSARLNPNTDRIFPV